MKKKKYWSSQRFQILLKKIVSNRADRPEKGKEVDIVEMIKLGSYEIHTHSVTTITQESIQSQILQKNIVATKKKSRKIESVNN